jgi:hypothetical protein
MHMPLPRHCCGTIAAANLVEVVLCMIYNLYPRAVVTWDEDKPDVLVHEELPEFDIVAKLMEGLRIRLLLENADIVCTHDHNVQICTYSSCQNLNLPQTLKLGDRAKCSKYSLFYGQHISSRQVRSYNQLLQLYLSKLLLKWVSLWPNLVTWSNCVIWVGKRVENTNLEFHYDWSCIALTTNSNLEPIMISIKFKKILEYPFDPSRCFLGGRVNHVSMCVSYDFDSFFWFIPTFHKVTHSYKSMCFYL